MGIWTNADGLRIKIGGSEANLTQGGEYPFSSELTVIEVRFNLTSLGSASALLEPGIIVPRNSRIEEVEVIAETAATSGGSATLNVGLVRLDNTTAIAANGLVSGLALTAIDAAQEKNVLRIGSTGVGTLVGTTTAFPAKFVADWDTAAYTAGVVLVRLKFYPPIPVAVNVNL